MAKNPSVNLKKKFPKNSSSSSALKVRKTSGAASDRYKDRRKSENVVDIRTGKEKTRNKLNIEHSRQIFDPKTSKNITKVVNQVVRSDPMNAKGPGMTKLRSPAKKVMYNKFSKSPSGSASKKGN